MKQLSEKQLLKKIEKLEKLVITDELTGFYNLRYLRETLRRELHRAKRYNRQFSLMVIDVDGFKEYNDTKGHILGNRALKCIAKALRQYTRKSTIHCRYGGDEFVLILPEADKNSSYVLGKRLKNYVKNKTNFSVSVGVSTFPEDGKTYKTLFNSADLNMYDDKGESK